MSRREEKEGRPSKVLSLCAILAGQKLYFFIFLKVFLFQFLAEIGEPST